MPPATIAARSGVTARRGLVVAAVSVAGLAAAATAATAAEVAAGETYEVAFEDNRAEDRLDDGSVTVASGDTLSLIAAEVGLDEAAGWRVLFDANDDIDDPDLILPGQELEVPEEGDDLERRAVTTASADPSGGGDDGSSGGTGDADGADQGQADGSASTESSSEPAQEGSAPAQEESAPAPAETESTAGGSVWDRLAQCESNGDWTINTGNGYYGGLQFHPQTWAAHGGHEFAPNAHQATREQEIVIAERVLDSQGWGAWPACSSQLGLR